MKVLHATVLDDREFAAGQPHPFLRLEMARRRGVVERRFGRDLPHPMPLLALSLYPFASQRPLKYFDHDVLRRMLAFIESDLGGVLQEMSKRVFEVSNAVFSVDRPGVNWDHEEKFSVDTPSDLLKFEQIWNPEYQRYCEQMLGHLIDIPLGVIGSKRQKDYTGQTLPNRMQQLDALGMGYFCGGYNATVRNAISHGGVAYHDVQVHYKDKKKTEEFWPSDFAKVFDTLVDTTHAFVAALLLAICRNVGVVEQHGFSNLPLGLRHMLYKGLSSYQGLHVKHSVETEVLRERDQLMIFAESSTRSRDVHMFDAFSVASHARVLGGQQYDRVLVSIECGPKIPGLVIFNGPGLDRVREDGLTDAAVKAALGSNVLWHNTSRFSRKVWTYRTVLSTSWEIFKQDVENDWRNAGLERWSSRFHVRDIRNVSAGRTRRIWAEVVLNEGELITKRVIRYVLYYATKRLRRISVRTTGLSGSGKVGRMPVYVWIRLHAKDARKRTLESEGHKDPNLVATSEWIARPRSLRPPLSEKTPDELFRGVRIRYNADLEYPD